MIEIYHIFQHCKIYTGRTLISKIEVIKFYDYSYIDLLIINFLCVFTFPIILFVIFCFVILSF